MPFNSSPEWWQCLNNRYYIQNYTNQTVGCVQMPITTAWKSPYPTNSPQEAMAVNAEKLPKRELTIEELTSWTLKHYGSYPTISETYTEQFATLGYPKYQCNLKPYTIEFLQYLQTVIWANLTKSCEKILLSKPIIAGGFP